MGSWQAMLRVHYANLPPCTQNHQNVPRLLSWNSWDAQPMLQDIVRYETIGKYAAPHILLKSKSITNPCYASHCPGCVTMGSLSYLCVSTLLSRGPTRCLKLSESLIRCSPCASIRVMFYYQNRKWIVSFLQRPMQMLKASYSMFVFDVYLR